MSLINDTPQYTMRNVESYRIIMNPVTIFGWIKLGWPSRPSQLFSKILLILLITLIILILIGGIAGCLNTLLTYFGAPPIDSLLINLIFSWAYVLRAYVDSNLILIGVISISLPIIFLAGYSARYLWLIKSHTSRDDEVVEN